MTRRIAHVSTAHPVGDNRILRKECRALADAGADVTLIAVAEHDDDLDGVRLAALPRRSGRVGRMLGGPIDAWRRLAREQPDVVHGHDPELLPLLMVWKLRHPNTTVIFDSHEDLPRQVMGKAYIPARLRPVVATLVKGLESVAERRLDLIVAATPAIAQKFTPERTLLVQNFPWLSDYPTPVDMPAGRLTLCYVGGISHGRGIVEMVQAVRSVGDGVRLVLAGPITPQAQALLDASSDLPIEYVGQMPGEDIPQLLAASSVGLALLHPLPNYLESQATKIFEYMASGRAFIASDFPAWRAMFERFDCGLFVNPLDPDAVADAVRELAGDPERAAAMGMAGRRAMQDHFTFEHEGRRLVERVLPA